MKQPKVQAACGNCDELLEVPLDLDEPPAACPKCGQKVDVWGNVRPQGGQVEGPRPGWLARWLGR